MREIKLRPVYDYDKYHEHILQVLEFELYYLIFRPLFDILGIETKELVEIRSGSRWNKAGSALERAIKAGEVTYVAPYFLGSFNALIGRELREMGATFDSRRKAYKLASLPVDLKTLIVTARADVKARAEALQSKLAEIEQKTLQVDLGHYVKNVFGDLDKQFVRTVKPNLEIPMEITAGMADKIEEDYTTNVNLYINGWKQEQIERLREQVQKNAAQGFRADKMKEVLMSEYGVSKNKAKFIARQETALMVSKYRQTRYEEAGINRYVWSTSHDERVRLSHRELNGKEFSWDKGALIRTPGQADKYCNPGEDFGCRCLAIPVMRLGGES